MKVSDLKNLFNQNIDISKFRESIQNETSHYKQQLMKVGSTAPIVVEEDASFCFTEKHLICLQGLLQSKSLSDIEVSYIADAITLADSINIETEELFDAIELLIID